MPVSAIALLMKQKIDQEPSLSSRNDIIILAHSMGGLVARAYMAETDGGDKVAKLITLATPHHGTPAANSATRNAIAPLGWDAVLRPVGECGVYFRGPETDGSA